VRGFLLREDEEREDTLLELLGTGVAVGSTILSVLKVGGLTRIPIMFTRLDIAFSGEVVGWGSALPKGLIQLQR
jgi:hypothetical protein